jgi:hypothetical protein
LTGIKHGAIFLRFISCGLYGAGEEHSMGRREHGNDATAVPERPQSLAELFGMLQAVADDMAARYEAFAATLRRYRNGPAADFFRSFAERERANASRVAETARTSGHHAKMPSDFDWAMREGLPAEAVAEAGGPWLMTTYGALSLAVRKEERLFALLSEISGASTEPEVRRWAGILAKETLDRIAELRLARRRAFQGAARVTLTAQSPEAFARIAAEIEREAARQAEDLARRLDALDRRAEAVTLDTVARDAMARAAAFATADSRAGSPTPRGWQFSRTPGSPGTNDALDLLRIALAQTEERYECYVKLAETAAEEALVRQSQTLAERAVRDLAAISASLTRLHDEPGADL